MRLAKAAPTTGMLNAIVGHVIPKIFFTDEEIARRRDDVIRRMGNTPPKLHKEMKLGKRKSKTGTSAGPKNPNEPWPRKDK